MYTHSTEAGWISRSHQAIAPFRLVRPGTTDEALQTLSGDGNAAVIAGGIDLTRRMRGGDRWDALVDISAIGELKGIHEQGGAVRIGALTSHWEMETDPLLAARLPDLQRAWKTIGNIRVRMSGTVGGNLMAMEAGYDGRVLLGALGAKLLFATAGGEIAVPVDAPPADTPDPALLIAVEIAVIPERKLHFDRSLKPVVSAATAVLGDEMRVGIGCAYTAPRFWSGPAGTAAAELSAALPEPTDNPMGGAAYRRRMAGVLAARSAQLLRQGD